MSCYGCKKAHLTEKLRIQHLAGPEGLAGAAAQCVPLLCDVINQADSRQPENINPTENAISAVTKILQFNGSQVNLDHILPMW